MKHHVYGETVNGAACEKLRDELAGGETFLKKFKVFPYVHSEMMVGLGDLWRNGRTTTIIRECADIYRKCGFEVTEQGIGWEIG